MAHDDVRTCVSRCKQSALTMTTTLEVPLKERVRKCRPSPCHGAAEAGAEEAGAAGDVQGGPGEHGAERGGAQAHQATHRQPRVRAPRAPQAPGPHGGPALQGRTHLLKMPTVRHVPVFHT